MLHRLIAPTAALLVVVTAATAVVAAVPTDHILCTLKLRRVSRDSSATYVLARSTRDTVLAGAGPIAGRSRVVNQHPGPIHGQVVSAERIVGAHDAEIRAALRTRGSSEIVVVPWIRNPACAPSPWPWSAQYTTPGARGVFELQLRAESLWVDGRPTFDALPGALQTYAYGQHVDGPQSDVRRSENPTPLPNLSIDEYWDLLMNLPRSGQTADSAALTHLWRWIDEHPDIRIRYPGNLLLRQYRADDTPKPPGDETELVNSTLRVPADGAELMLSAAFKPRSGAPSRLMKATR
ncbi:MAG TPA: hypothetical protein VH277_17365 [Gemmatimonadaceae bacterium]|nr:hypothetical protein [Gemmatimonadaceae bacterium]